MLAMLRRVRTKAWLVKMFLHQERMSPVSLPITDRLRAWKYGMTSRSYKLYRSTDGFPEDLIPDWAEIKMGSIVGYHREILSNKVLFEPAMRGYVDVPKNLALIVRGRVVALQESVALNSAEALIDLAQDRPLVLKPLRGYKGKGVIVLRATGTGVFVNDRQRPAAEMRALIAGMDDHLVTEFVQQAAYAVGLFPRATNTIRLMTMVDPETQEPFIPFAMQKIGTEASAPVDNYAAGGISAGIDLDTGVLGPAIRITEDCRMERHATHPDVGSQIEGVQIPRWPDIKETMLRTARLLPYLKCVGWDIVVTDEGFQAIEGNGRPGFWGEHVPPLRDPRVRKFYRYHGII